MPLRGARVSLKQRSSGASIDPAVTNSSDESDGSDECVGVCRTVGNRSGGGPLCLELCLAAVFGSVTMRFSAPIGAQEAETEK